MRSNVHRLSSLDSPVKLEECKQSQRRISKMTDRLDALKLSLGFTKNFALKVGVSPVSRNYILLLFLLPK